MFAYCNNNPIQFTDTTGDFFLVDDLVLAAGLLIFAVVVIEVYTPPVQEAIRNLADVITDVFMDTAHAIENTIEQYKEHTKGARSSTKGTHEKGQKRKQTDAGGEKGDARRVSRNNKRVGIQSKKGSSKKSIGPKAMLK